MVFMIGEHTARANSRDGYAIQHARKMGYNVFVISGGSYAPVMERLLNIGVQEVFMGAKEKLSVYKKLLEDNQLTNEEVLYMGDDLPDYPVLNEAGVSTCPKDAATEILNMVDYVSHKNGGGHCRDVIEQTLDFTVNGLILNTRKFGK